MTSRQDHPPANNIPDAAEARVRVRQLGITPGVFEPAEHNSITDVGSVQVGQVTLHRGDHVRTGVTAVRPHPGNLVRDTVPAGVFAGNGFGKLAGSTQVDELGILETPIVLTNTLSVGTAVEAVVSWTLDQPGNHHVRSLNAVVGETNDGSLNDIRGFHVTRDDVRHALDSATGQPVDEGSVGAGTGTVCFGWKGGIGTASRILPEPYGGYTLGVLIQTNYGGLFTLDGVPVGRELGHTPFAAEPAPSGDGSCMIVVATDAPLDARDLERVAARAVFGLARTGSSYAHGSGDYAIAFQTSRRQETLPAGTLSALFQASLEATEEAVYNSLCRATPVTGNQVTVDALPLDEVRRLLRSYGRAG